MKIVYLHQYFNTPQMPGGTRSYEMARRLARNGHEVDIVTSWRENDGRSEWFETEEAGVRVHWLPVPYSNSMSYRNRIQAFVRFAICAAQKARSLSADVIFATSTPLTIALPGIYASKCQKVPMVFEVRDLWPELPIAIGAIKNPIIKFATRWLERVAYQNSAHIVALSPGMRDGVVNRGTSIEKVSIIPNSCDIDLFDSSKADPEMFLRDHPELRDAPLVVYTGTMGAINGVEYLVKIARESLDLKSDVKYVIVGRGGEEAKVRQAAELAGVLGNNFFMYEAVSKEMMPNVLASATVALSFFVDLEPMWANSANKFFDALASGTPVAINYSGWQADLLRSTDAGIVLPANSPSEAAKLLLLTVADTAWLRTAGQCASEVAETRFSRDLLARQLEDVLVVASGGDID